MTYKRRVLIVEDDGAMISMLRTMLENEGYETRSALGEKALQLAEEYQPDVILLDLMMPIMDGFEWSNRAKANPKLNKIPIIVLSAASPGAIDIHYKDLQASSYLPKPFEIEHLLQLVNVFSFNPDNLVHYDAPTG
jgi:CheY-like chemotaxis protein